MRDQGRHGIREDAFAEAGEARKPRTLEQALADMQQARPDAADDTIAG